MSPLLEEENKDHLCILCRRRLIDQVYSQSGRGTQRAMTIKGEGDTVPYSGGEMTRAGNQNYFKTEL